MLTSCVAVVLPNLLGSSAFLYLYIVYSMWMASRSCLLYLNRHRAKLLIARPAVHDTDHSSKCPWHVGSGTAMCAFVHVCVGGGGIKCPHPDHAQHFAQSLQQQV